MRRGLAVCPSLPECRTPTVTGTVTEKLVSFLGEQGAYSRPGGATEREPDVYGHGRAR